MTALTRNEIMNARRRRPGPSDHGFVPERQGRAGQVVSSLLRRRRAETVVFPPRKEEAPCCERRRLPDGRPVLGFCSPECVRRPGNWALVVDGKPIPKGGVPPRSTQGGTQ